MRKFLTSGSMKVSGAGSAVLSSSPTYLNTVGLAGGTGSALATWYAGSAVTDGSPIWTLAVAASGYVGQNFSAPILIPKGLVINVVSGGSANTAWGV